jgi:hypothetical protein
MRDYRLGKGTVLELLHQAGDGVRYPRLSEEELNRAAQLYASGLSLPKVGVILGRPPTTVHLALKRVGVLMRSPHLRLR